MPSNSVDISHLLTVPDDLLFIDLCFQTLLERAISPEELRFARHMLNKGLSRKGFVYWISRSPEFNSRFTINNLSSFALPCYFYKCCEKLSKFMHLAPKFSVSFTFDANEKSCSPICFAAPDPGNSDYFNIEFSALSLGQIFQIPSAFPNIFKELSWHCIGHIASDLLPAENVSTSLLPEDFSTPCSLESDKSIHKNGNFFITAPSVIFELFTQENLHTITSKLENYFVFTMPALSDQHTEILVVWDKFWNTPEVNAIGFYRWLQGLSNTGRIYIINQTTSYKKVSINFTLLSLYTGSVVKIKYNDIIKNISLRNTLYEISLELWLNPGTNILTFTYLGPSYSPQDEFTQSMTFGINNLMIKELLYPNLVYSNEDVYRLSSSDLGESYLPFMLPDNYIRSILHQNGFFEINAVSIYHNYSVKQRPSTYYDHLKDERHKTCYHTFSVTESVKNIISDSSVTVYLARRTTNFKKDSVFL